MLSEFGICLKKRREFSDVVQTDETQTYKKSFSAGFPFKIWGFEKFETLPNSVSPSKNVHK